MITSLEIKNFKSLKKIQLEPKALNLFTGLNSTGKSSFLHFLILLHQTFNQAGNAKNENGLFLGNRESWINLGTFYDVINQNAEKDEFLYFSAADEKSTVTFQSDLYTSDNKSSISVPGIFNLIGDYESSGVLGNRIEYLASDRISPQEDYPRFQNEDNKLGKDGRYAPHYLTLYGNEDIATPLVTEEMIKPVGKVTLNTMVALWMQEISPNIQFKVEENLVTNRIELTYTYKLGQRGFVPSQDRKTVNVGFGITHTLPVLVALLSAKPGDILMIENPETHLHPKGQSKLGMLMTLVANTGVQLFVETHSDHILNGIRVATKKGLISPEKTSIQFFSQNPETGNSIMDVVGVDGNGRLDKWPKYFFDEWGNMLDELL